jgi:hypothetical protein
MKPKPKKPRKICLDKLKHKSVEIFPDDWVYLQDKSWGQFVGLSLSETKKLYNWLTKQQKYTNELKRRK